MPDDEAHAAGRSGRARPGGRRTLAQRYRRSGEEAAATSPLYGAVAVALSESEAALRAVAAAPARARHPAQVLAALHDLALAGRAPALAAAYAAADRGAAARAAVDTLLETPDAVMALAGRRQARTPEPGACAALYPAVAAAAGRAGARAVGLVGLGCSAGLDLHVDRVGITYGSGPALGDASSPVQLTASVVGDRDVPARSVPQVVARVGVDPAPLDVTDADDVRWLQACLPPDQPERAARLGAQLALAATAPPLLLQGSVLEVLPDALTRVPAHALPVVTTTWALSRLPLADRRCFLRRLGEAADGRAVAWVSVEGVGVAPGVPTLGDRAASGHSIVGVVVLDGSALRAEAVARCYGRGRWLGWLAEA